MKKNNLTTTNQNAKLALSKTRNLLDVTNKILTNKKSTPPTKAGRISDDQTRAIEFEDNIEAWIDKDTGLMWEVKTKENVGHNYAWSEEYVGDVYYEEYIGDVYYLERLTDSVKDAFSYAKKLNELNYAGFSDWRIPTKDELTTLLTEEKNNGQYIKISLSKNITTSSDNYWSSTTAYEIYTGVAWYIDFDDGDVYNVNKDADSYVRCVRDR